MRRRLKREEQQKLQAKLHEIFISTVGREGPVASEAYGEDFFLLNMSSRVNAGEALSADQLDLVDRICRRETSQSGP